MDDFEFIFALFSLLLGLSMVELLSGLGRALETRFTAMSADPHSRNSARPRFLIGWLTPLLAIFVMLDLLSFWMAAWAVRAHLTVSATSLLAVSIFASFYYLAARLVFPSQPENFTDLDTHYFRVRRIVLGLLLALLIAQLGFYLTIPAMAALLTHPLVWTTTLMLVVLMGAAMVVKNMRWNAILLALLILRYLVIYIV